MKNICIFGTGGTIVCSDQGQGLRPHYTVDDLISRIQPGINCRVVGQTVMNIDSSNMTPDCWLTIARHIDAQHARFDGFVVTHGTDTMAYTAAALSYLLQGRNKPIILTGSQFSIADSRTDALQNLRDALLIACEDIAGVFVVFDGQVINGTRAIKTKTQSYDAFESINYPLIATIKHNRIEYSPGSRTIICQNHQSHQPPVLIDRFDEQLLVLKMFPGLDPKIFAFIRENYKAVVIESYGTGGIATEGVDLAGSIRELAEAGIIVAITTQCLEEGVDLQLYEVGRQLPLSKIVYARDMNSEALVPKLMWAMAKASSFEEIKVLIETPVQDDLIPHDKAHF